MENEEYLKGVAAEQERIKKIIQEHINDQYALKEKNEEGTLIYRVSKYRLVILKNILDEIEGVAAEDD